MVKRQSSEKVAINLVKSNLLIVRLKADIQLKSVVLGRSFHRQNGRESGRKRGRVRMESCVNLAREKREATWENLSRCHP